MGEEIKTYTLEDANSMFARKINGRVWDLLGKGDRSREETEEMIHAAHASCYHWLSAGTVVNQQRGEWMISHVYAYADIGEAALRHAKRCMELTDANKMELKDFDIAYAYEAMARAFALTGRIKDAKKFIKLAKEAGENISGEEDRKYFLSDFNGGDWKGLK